MSRILMILLSVIPGTTMILRGRVLTGSMLMVIGLLAWNVGFIGFTIWQGDEGPFLGWAGVLVAGACTVGSVVWTSIACSRSRQRRLRERADRSLRIAQHAYLRNRLAKATLAVEVGLRGSHHDIDLLFMGWQIAKRSGEQRRARRLLKRLRRADIEGKWDWEVDREEERVA